MSKDDARKLIVFINREIILDETNPEGATDRRKYLTQTKLILQQYGKHDYLKNDPECQTLEEFGLKKYKAGYDQGRFDERMDKALQQHGQKAGVKGKTDV